NSVLGIQVYGHKPTSHDQTYYFHITKIIHYCPYSKKSPGFYQGKTRKRKNPAFAEATNWILQQIIRPERTGAGNRPVQW
ncbi:MAG: hypothetical protein WCI92_19540, partial [Bacteroidota bacterium]